MVIFIDNTRKSRLRTIRKWIGTYICSYFVHLRHKSFSLLNFFLLIYFQVAWWEQNLSTPKDDFLQFNQSKLSVSWTH